MVTTYETQVDENGETGLNEEANASKKTTEDEGNCWYYQYLKKIFFIHFCIANSIPNSCSSSMQYAGT